MRKKTNKSNKLSVNSPAKESLKKTYDERIRQEINDGKFNHKAMFFFMPEDITFIKPDHTDDESTSYYRSIMPYFYWCSAHEFPDLPKKYRYLIQYQNCFIDNGDVFPGEIMQKFCANKDGIRAGLHDFIEMWDEHKRIMLDPTKIISMYKADINNINHLSEELNNKNISASEFAEKIINGDNNDSFIDFAKAIGKTIKTFQEIYVTQAKDKQCDLLQKEYWRSLALEFAQSILKNKERANKEFKELEKPDDCEELEEDIEEQKYYDGYCDGDNGK
jgi:hypothetical protein